MLRFYDKEKRDITDELDSPSLFCGNPACLGEPWCSAWGICKDVAVEPKNSAAAMEEEEVSGVEQEYTSLFLELSQQLESSSTPELSPAQASSLASSTLPQPSTSSIVSSIHFPVKNEPSSSSTKSRQKGLLGDKNPKTLLDTMIFCNGLYFALRSGREHRQLRLRPCQIQLIENKGERPYLQYTEDVSKNRPGGIKGRNIKPKIVLHHANTDNPERCFVRLFKKYIKLCPDSPDEINSFYLQPATNPTMDLWYTRKPLGHNTLTKTISRLCTAAGIEGFKIIHCVPQQQQDYISME